MSSIEPPGSQPPPPPTGKSAAARSSFSQMEESNPWLLQSPFAKMFEATGAPISGKEIKQMIDTLLKDVMLQMKKDGEKMKATLKKMKRIAEGSE